jgi:hypothetical protein
MDKNIIKKHLTQKFVNEAKEETNTPGISVTKATHTKSGEENKKGVKDMDKGLADYQKSLEKGMETTKTPNKFNYEGDKEIEYHNQMENMNGQEMIEYDRDPIQEFKDRARMAIEGAPEMGNSPEWANVVPKQQGFTGPEFGKNLVKNAEASFKKRMDAQKGIMSFGEDIEVIPKNSKPMARFSALAENKDNNKSQIKESMKRLNFKKEFNGVGNALKMIPESYKVDNKVFEMTDGVENYKIRWEGNLTEGKAVVLIASDKNLVNEDMQKMKRLMGYKSQETLGIVKGKARLDENKMFTDIWSKTKSLMEMEEIEGQDAEKEAEFDKADVKHAAEAKKHVEGSVSSEKGTKAPAPKTGNFDEVKKSAPEAKKHVEGSVSSEKGTKAPAPKTGNWDEINVPQAAEAKKHVHMGKAGMNEGIQLGESYFEPMDENLYEYGDEHEVATIDAVKQMDLDEYGDEHQIPTDDAVNQMELDEYGDEHEISTDNAVQSIEVGAEKVADKIESILSPEEVNFLVQAYQQGGKEMVANALNQSVNEGLPEPPAEGDYGMSQSELKLRQILEKVIMRGALSSLAGIIPAAMMGHPGLAVGLGIAALAGTALKDAAWWKKNGHHYGAQGKYGVK